MYKFCANVVKLFLQVNGSKAKVYGEENVPKEGGFVIACTHNGYIDIFNLGTSVLPRPVHFMAKKQLFDMKVIGWLVKNLNAFPVDRDNPGPSVIKIPRQLIKEGKIVGIFPSGTRSQENTDLKQGAVTIAQLSKSIIVPAAYIGPKNIKGVLKREKAYLIYGEPIEIGPGKEARDEATHLLEERMNTLLEEIRTKM